MPVLPFGGDVISSTEALSLPEIPKNLVVVGAGYIGLELGTAFRKLGAAVTIVEAADRILPRYDEALTRPVRRWLTRNGVTLHLGATVTGRDGDGRLAVETASGKLALDAEKILVTVGRLPLTEGWGLEEMAVDRDGRFVRVDDQCRTSMRNVWAIGDLVGEPMLAHKAMAQGAMVAEIIAGQRRHFDPAAVAAIVFTDPEIVVAGMLPDEAAAAGFDAETSIFPFAANGRALTLGSRRGRRVRARRVGPGRPAHPRHPGGRPRSRRAGRRVRARAGDGGGARRSGAHDPRPPDPRGGGRRGRAARPRSRAAP